MTPLALIILALIVLRSRCAAFQAQSPADCAGKGPQFDRRHHLSGPIQCEAVIFGPTGRVTSRFRRFGIKVAELVATMRPAAA